LDGFLKALGGSWRPKYKKVDTKSIVKSGWPGAGGEYEGNPQLLQDLAGSWQEV